jgi:hypothetical protein
MDTETVEREVNFSDRGLQLTRMWRALKIWMSFNAFGARAFERAVDRSLDLAELAGERIEASDELELLRPVGLGVVCFRRRFGNAPSSAERETLNRRLVAGLERSGVGHVSSTRLRGEYAIRLVVLNHTTTESDVTGVLDWLESADVTLGPPSPVATDVSEPHADRNEVLGSGWAAGGDVSADAIGDLDLFAGLDDEQLALVQSTAEVTEAAPEENITTRWGSGRHLYVILDGRVRVEVDGEVVRDLGRGGFFGELAALDWGAGFGYTRTASVVALDPTRLLVVPPDTVNALASRSPELDAELRRAVREHLGRT